ncbi:MAG: hypothetical protein RML72_12725 [Bacteroidia bacterium]|nr:lamin tail domain-containing protein [Bacteroidia bacterium]MDW8159722.1 hypothetical protein [Bacteroidia bacterium]
MLKKDFLILSCLSWMLPMNGNPQVIEISKFIPGNYLTDNNHLVELFNPSKTPVSLEGFLLITRDYALRFPANIKLLPYQRLKIGKKKGKPHNVDFELIEQPDFSIRLYNKKIEGNYCVLQNSQGKIIDAFYHSQLAATPILPDSGVLILHNGAALPYQLPAEHNPLWGYFPIGEDPAVGFEKYKGQWRVIPALSKINLYPATAFREVNVRYSKKTVILKWITEFEEDVPAFLIQKSTNQVDFQTIDTLEALGSPAKPTQYVYYDVHTDSGKTYYYRITNLASEEKTIYSKIVEIEASEPPIEFQMELFPLEGKANQHFSLRFSTAYSQFIKIKVLDNHFKEWAILFYDWVYAYSQNLLHFELNNLPSGKYILVASTEAKRYFQNFIVLNN